MSKMKIKCTWCLKPNRRASGYKQKHFITKEWLPLCVKCYRRRIKNLSSALLPIREIETNHDHTCHCGGNPKPHQIGDKGCLRFIAASPRKLRDEGFWLVDHQKITEFTMRQQRGYHQHQCGCWSRWEGSTNSIEA